MAITSITPILNVSDISVSAKWFSHFGWRLGFAWNGGGMIQPGASHNDFGQATFGSVCSEGVEIFLCVGAQGARGTIEPRFPGDDEIDGVWMTWWIDSEQEHTRLYEVAVREGCNVTYPPTDEPWGVREFHLRHPDGHTFRVSSHISKRDRIGQGQ